MNPSNCTAISKKTQELKPPESIMLQIYPFLSTISLQSLAGFPIFEKLGYSLDRRQAVPGQRTSPPPHTSRFLPPPTFVGRHVGPSLFSPRARGARLLRQGVPGRAVAFGPSAALGIASRCSRGCSRGCSSARNCGLRLRAHPARCKATSPRTPQPPGGGWEGKRSVTPNWRRSILFLSEHQ